MQAIFFPVPTLAKTINIHPLILLEISSLNMFILILPETSKRSNIFIYSFRYRIFYAS